MVGEQIPRLRTITKILLWVVLADYLVWPNPSSAFYDDLCFTSPGATATVGNCLANTAPNCSIVTTYVTKSYCVPASCGANAASETNATCVANVNASFNNGNAPNARSMIHADSIYLLAKAVGLQDRVAYFLAAYGDTPDKDGQFILMLPACTGGPTTYYPDTDPQHATIALPGLYRGSASGDSIHFPLVTGTVAGTPNPTDTIHEGVSRLRSWALGSSSFPCFAGLTAPTGTGASLSYYSGAQCYVSSSPSPISFEGGTYHVNPTANVTSFATYQSGDQIFSSSSGLIIGTGSYWFEDDLQGQLNASTGRLADGVTPVPMAILAMGVYLHSLLDRVSHAPALVPLTVSGPSTNVSFDAKSTYFPSHSHAYLHFEEVGIPVLSPRTENALNLAYDELTAFAALNPTFMTSSPVVAPKSNVVPPLVNTVLNQRSAAVRLARLEELSKTLGYSWLAQGSNVLCGHPVNPGRPGCGQVGEANTCE
jgi:hypothetical protein